MNSNTQDSSLNESMIKLLIIGGPQVGKSSLVSKFCNNTHNPSYIPTSGVHFKYKMLEFASKKLKVQVWDTAGTDHSDPLLKIYYKKAMGILLAFALNNKQSLEDLEKWMQHLQSNVNPNAFIVLVGNKSDMTERAVKDEEIRNFQKKYKIDKYVETSVKEGSSVNEVFTELVKEVKDRIEKGSFKTDDSSSHALGNIEKKPLVSSLTKLDSDTVEKEVTEEKDLSAELKAREEELDRKAEEAFEGFKKQMALELKENRRATRDEIDKKLYEATESLRKELTEKIALRDRVEEDYKKKAEENMNTLRNEVSFFRKVFDNFSQSNAEETFQLTLKTEQTLAGLVKENAMLEERLAKMEKQLRDSSNILDSNHKEDIHSSAYKRKQRKTDTEIVDITANLARSRSDKVEAEGSSIQRKAREASFDKTSRDLNESTRNCSNSTEIFYAGGGKKAMESGERRVILDSINNPNAFLETERTWEKDIDSALPKFYSSGDEELYKNVEELQYNMMVLTQEMKRTQNKMNSLDVGKRSRRHLRSICKKANKENRLFQYNGVLDSSEVGNEINRLWETINSLVKNTHEEIDKVKDQVKRMKGTRITDRRDALVEKNANGSMRELRDDIHNQLIEIQRELEGKYGTLRTNLTLNYESFLKYFNTEQSKLREHMEDRCMEIIEEALKSKDKSEELVVKRSYSDAQSPASVKTGVKGVKTQALETIEEMKRKKSLAVKIMDIEAQQKKMFSSYSNSFKSIWESVQILTDKMNELDNKGSYIAEISRTGGMVNNYVDWRKMDY